MKKYSKYHLPTLLFMLAAGFMSVSCADEDIANDQKYDGKNGVSFSVTDVQDALDADIQTRATDAKTYLTHSIDFNEASTSDICLQESTVPGVNPMKRTPQTRAWLKNSIDANFGVFACKNSSARPDYFYNEQVMPSGQMLKPKFWGSTASTLKFYAIYPYMDGTNTRQKLVQPTTGSLPYVAFEASTDIAKQTDLMTAETTRIKYMATGGSPHVVPLKFYHALTAIRFGIGSNLSLNKTIKSIEFQGINNAGQYDLATKKWSKQRGAQNFKIDNINKSTSGTQNTVIVKDGNTFLMVPQKLPSGAKIVITFADNSHITANIGGKTWAPGTTKTYMMTEKNSSWEYKIEATDPAVIAYDKTTSTTPYTITSYRKDPATNTFQPVKWKVVGYEESKDGGKTWGAKPAWLTALNKESGNGGTAAEGGKVTVKKDIIDRLAIYNKVLQDATPKGSSGSPYDLSMHNYKGESQKMNTANSYLISAPGYYKIPLVYGNAIKYGETYSRSYQTSKRDNNILTNFKDHAGKDIASPYINVQNSSNPATQASIVWTDQKGIVQESSLSVTGKGKNSYVNFYVPADKIKNGNAVIAVKNKDKVIMWSWHLWFDHGDVLDVIPCTNFNRIPYNFTKQTLGFAYRRWDSSTYDKPRMARVKVEQTIANGGTKKFAYIYITQNPGKVKKISTTHYQFGRKDAFPGIDKIADGYFNPNGGYNMSITNGIQHPETFYPDSEGSSAWYSGYNQYNLWSMDETIGGFNDRTVIKTIYDPCPAGFHMPASNAFTGLSKDGKNYGPMNVSGAWDNGWHFNNKVYSPDATVYFPVAGWRDAEDGSLIPDKDIRGFYWSAVPKGGNGCCMDLGSSFDYTTGSVYPLNFFVRALGCSVRPVEEYRFN